MCIHLDVTSCTCSYNTQGLQQDMLLLFSIACIIKGHKCRNTLAKTSEQFQIAFLIWVPESNISVCAIWLRGTRQLGRFPAEWCHLEDGVVFLQMTVHADLKSSLFFFLLALDGWFLNLSKLFSVRNFFSHSNFKHGLAWLH